MASGRIIVFDWPGAEASPLYAWRDRVGAEFVSVDGTAADWMPPDGTVLVVTAQTYSMPHVTILRQCVERGIPVLTLADGILEFRNTWRNLMNPPGTLFMPVFGHKMACVGRAQAARIASWGNSGVCEVVGFPPLDSVKRFPVKSNRITRVLVATANTPWFDESQREIVLQSLRDVRDELALRSDLEVWWRVSSDAASVLGVRNHVERFGDMPMDRCIDEVDAVISTPSTLLLYPMLQGKPALALDYTGLPHYCRFPLTLASRNQVAFALDGLNSFPADLGLYQRQLLDDELEWEGRSEDRLVRLVLDMAECGRQARVQGGRLELPYRMVPLSERSDSLLSDGEYDTLFARVHEVDDVASSHAEVIRLRDALHRRAVSERELKQHIDELGKGKDWLESQWLAWKSSSEALELQLHEATTQVTSFEAGIAKHEDEIKRLTSFNLMLTRACDETAAEVKLWELRAGELEFRIARFKKTLLGRLSKLLRLI